MKIVLWAAHEAGYRAYRKLYAAGHRLLVFTEESPQYVPAITELTKALGQSTNVGTSNDSMMQEVSEFRPDLGISMYYPRIIKADVLAIPVMGGFNFHPALLPRHRGCFSAPWAILEGDIETGVTCHEMVAKVDKGRILCRSSIIIDRDETAFSLYYRLVDSALELLDEALVRLAREPVLLENQGEDGCYHPREVPYGGKIDPEWPVDMVERFIRAMFFPPHPPARLVLGGVSYPVPSLDEYMRLLNLHG